MALQRNPRRGKPVTRIKKARVNHLAPVVKKVPSLPMINIEIVLKKMPHPSLMVPAEPKNQNRVNLGQRLSRLFPRSLGQQVITSSVTSFINRIGGQ